MLFNEKMSSMTKPLLNWFVSAQLEEVSSVSMLLSFIRQAGKDDLLFVEADSNGLPQLRPG